MASAYETWRSYKNNYDEKTKNCVTGKNCYPYMQVFFGIYEVLRIELLELTDYINDLMGWLINTIYRVISSFKILKIEIITNFTF